MRPYHERDIEAFRPPPRAVVRLAARLAAPWWAYTAPQLYGRDRLPDDRPLMFIGNHTLLGVYDVPYLAITLYERHGLWLRGLADWVHMRIPGWRNFMTWCGVVNGTADNCRRILRMGDSALIFPGGGREVARRRDDKYKLHWKKRAGFARLALEQGVTIVPFSMVGVEESWDVIYDAEQLMATPLGRLVERWGVRQEIIWPLVKGLGPTGLPRPGRFIYHLGEPIETRSRQSDHPTDEDIWAVREQTREAVESGIAWLLQKQATEADPSLDERLKIAREVAGGSDPL